MSESGLPGFDVVSWFGLFAPAGTPQEIVQRVNAQTLEALRDKTIRARLTRDGIEPVGSTPKEFAAFVQAEITRWARLVQQSGARID